MQFVPWRYISDWHCISCGSCCQLYSVVINFHEWLKIVKNFGVEKTASGLDKLYIKRDSDGSCAFLLGFSDCYTCGLQYMKPKACKLWPFKILTSPRFGCAEEAAYEYGENRLFIYLDSMCNGIRYGEPTWEFGKYTVREFAEIALGIRDNQLRTTAKMFPRQDFSFKIPRWKGYL